MSTMTKIVQRMEIDGLVASNPRQSDARITEVRLTDIGRGALPEIRELAGQVFRRGFDTLDGKAVDELVATLKVIFASLEQKPV